MRSANGNKPPVHVPSGRGWSFSGKGDKNLEDVYVDSSWLFNDIFSYEVGTTYAKGLIVNGVIKGRKIS